MLWAERTFSQLSKQKTSIMKVLVLGLAYVAISFAAHIDIQPAAMNCDEPICIDNSTYYPHWDPYFYYECIPDLECGWSPILRPCAPGAVFSFEQQVCVGCDEWEDPCGVGPPPKTTTERNPVTTPPPNPPCEFPPICLPEWKNVLLPDKDCHKYWQMVDDPECDCSPVLRNCSANLYFSYKLQTCAFCDDWDNVCEIDPGTSTQSTTTDGPAVVEPCGEPSCEEVDDKTLRFADDDPNIYWECVLVGGTWQSAKRECSGDLLFEFPVQICVPESDWTNLCGISTPTPTTPTTTSTTTTPSTTTTSSTTTSTTTTTSTPSTTTTTSTPSTTTTTSTPSTTSSTSTTTQSPSSTTTRGPLPPPICTWPPYCPPEWEWILMPDEDVTKFWQFIADSGAECEEETPCIPILQDCPPGLWFSYKEQVCDWDCNWDNPCNLTTTSGTSSTTPSTTTERPGPVEPCGEPNCEELDDKSWRFADEDPTIYWECVQVSGIWSSARRECGGNLLFEFDAQICVPESEWTNLCGISTPTPTTPTPTTPTPTTPTPTTPTPTTPTPTTPTPTTPTPTTPTPTTQTPSSTTTRGPLPPPICTWPPYCPPEWEWILMPDEDVTKFWQFIADSGAECEEETPCIPVLQDCPPGLWFSYKEQVCDWDCNWDNPCNLTTTPGTTSSTTPSTTTERPGPVEPCGEPNCEELDDKSWRFADEDPTIYWECVQVSGSWSSARRECGGNLLFEFDAQICVPESEWTNLCGISTPTPTTPTTTSTTTTPSTTTTSSTTTSTTTTTSTPSTTTTTSTPSTTSSTSTTTQSPSSTTTRGPLPPPICTWPPYCPPEWEWILMPDEDVTKFWQFKADSGAECEEETPCIPVLQDCPPGLWFSYKEQVCDWDCNWDNPCNLTTTQGTTSSTTPSTTTELPAIIGDCDEPECDENNKDFTFPHEDPEWYWECIPSGSGWTPVSRRCLPDTWRFHYQRQSCVIPNEWVNVCGDEESTTTTSTTTSTTTTPSTTTTSSTTTPSTTTTSSTTTQSTTTTSSTTTPSTTTTSSTTPTVSPPSTELPPPPPCSWPPLCPPEWEWILYPDEDPKHYWQFVRLPEEECEGEVPGCKPVLMDCPPTLLFSWYHQVCVYCFDWEPICPTKYIPNCV